MPTVNVNVQPAIISWALSQTSEEKLGTKLMENIKQWLDGTKRPTFNQIEDFSKKSHIPLGYFFLQTPPVEQISLLEYRTLDSIELTNPSRNLIDTIREMEAVQEWMTDYRKEWNYDVINVVGSLKDFTDIKIIADTIRNDLGLTVEWYGTCTDSSEAFNKVRKLLEDCGIVVMMNGIVGKNTHRVLDVNEFRAFAMVNEWAPLIFINGADSAGGKLFSLFHETVHLWIGENDLYNDRRYSINETKPIEFICNAVMTTREEVLKYGMTFPEVYQDAPFHDPNWILVRYKKNKKAFLWTYEYQGQMRINVKADPEWIDFWRKAYEAVIPGYHQNKKHWNTVILDGSVPDGDVKRMIAESYDLVR